MIKLGYVALGRDCETRGAIAAGHRRRLPISSLVWRGYAAASGSG